MRESRPTSREPAGHGRPRPLVGVTGSDRRGRFMWWANRFALWRAGARALRLVPGRPAATDRLDALVVGGGDDIGAELYDGQIMLDVRVDPERDALERDLIAAAEARGLPVLGICRGAQMINIARGGDLHQEVREAYEGVPRGRTVLPRRMVTTRPGSRLRDIVEKRRFPVNVLHHQAIRSLGRGLRVAARDRFGVVQAIEGDGERFVVGVQWHPEFLVLDRGQLRLYRGLVAAAGNHGAFAGADEMAGEMSPT